MSFAEAEFSGKSRLGALLDHFSVIEDPRVAWRVAHPLPEVLLLVVFGTLAAWVHEVWPDRADLIAIDGAIPILLERLAHSNARPKPAQTAEPSCVAPPLPSYIQRRHPPPRPCPMGPPVPQMELVPDILFREQAA